jgi:uncharacterized protein YjeT (DUF2065 family)
MPVLQSLDYAVLFLTVESLSPDLSSLRLFGVLILAIGVLSLLRPQIFWHLRVGRKIPGVPPNKLYLIVLRFGGVLVVALGLWMLFGLSL